MSGVVEEMDRCGQDGRILVSEDLLSASLPYQLNESLILRRDQIDIQGESPENAIRCLNIVDHFLKVFLFFFNRFNSLGNIVDSQLVLGKCLLYEVNILQRDTGITLWASV
jgi:hypothetical protein